MHIFLISLIDTSSICLCIHQTDSKIYVIARKRYYFIWTVFICCKFYIQFKITVDVVKQKYYARFHRALSKQFRRQWSDTQCIAEILISCRSSIDVAELYYISFWHVISVSKPYYAVNYLRNFKRKSLKNF